MTLVLLSALIGSFAAAAWAYLAPRRLTPDGVFYLSSASGTAVPRPYSYRWLLPRALGTSPLAWRVVSTTTLVAAATLLGVYLRARGADDARALLGVALCAGLPGIFRVGMEAPVLTDQFALAASLAAAVSIDSGHIAIGVLAALLGGLARETVPVWAAIYAWSALPLLGLIAVAAIALLVRSASPVTVADPRRAWNLSHPFAAARAARIADSENPFLAWLAPWGVLALLVPFGALTLQLGAALGLGYAQLLAATDRARLYQQAAPVVIAGALVALPEGFAAAALAAHYANPWRGSGY